MQTNLTNALIGTTPGKRADQILRSCVHCGFCNATCPTYQLTSNELDGPRGRIYLIKEMLAANEPNPTVVKHLDRCLTCRACESTCPSGVAYGELLEIGRNFSEPKVKRATFRRWLRAGIRHNVTNPGRMRLLLALARFSRWLLPRSTRKLISRSGREKFTESVKSERRVIILRGCSARYLTPATTEALTSLLTQQGIEYRLIETETCCGALDLHLGEEEAALTSIRNNLQAIAPQLDEVEAILSTASGCGITVKDYGRLLAEDAQFSELAESVSKKTLDASEFLCRLELAPASEKRSLRIAWQAPCSLQHGQNLIDEVPELLRNAGYELCDVPHSGVCCGSAGAYSILEKQMANDLKHNKLQHLMHDHPDIIATANIGCQTHLMTEASVPVVHYLELLK